MSRITLTDCRQIVGEYYRIPKEDMLGRVKTRRIARPRQMAMTLAIEMTDQSTVAIGRHFNRDHSTALFAQERIYELEEYSFHIAQNMENFRLALITYKAQQEVDGP